MVYVLVSLSLIDLIRILLPHTRPDNCEPTGTRYRNSYANHCLLLTLIDLSFSEYRSAIYANSPDQLEVAKQVTAEVQAKHFTPKDERIVTEVVEAGPWYNAEEYHQLYLFKNPNGYECPTHRLHW